MFGTASRIVLIVVFGGAFGALGQDGADDLSNNPFAKNRGLLEKRQRKLRAEITKKYDKNGDGQLRGAEYKAASPEYRKRYAEIRDELDAKLDESFDSDGDGKLSPSESYVKRMAEKKYEEARRAAEEAERRKRAEEYRRRQELREYDADKNGKLDEKELAKMKADREEAKALMDEAEKSLLEQFDADKDGQFNKQEMAKVKAHLVGRLKKLKAYVDVSRHKKLGNDRSWDEIEDTIRDFRFR